MATVNTLYTLIPDKFTSDKINNIIEREEGVLFWDEDSKSLNTWVGGSRVEYTDGTSKTFNVDDYGAIGDGVTDDTAAIQLCIDSATTNDIIVFSPNKTYLIFDKLSLLERVYMGYGSTIKRADAVTSTLSSVAVNGTTSIIVNDGSVFSIGDEVIILDGGGTFGGSGYSENSAVGGNVGQVITNISGNTLTLDSGIGLPLSGDLDGANQFPIGSVVLKVFTLAADTGSNIISIYGLTFDGNKANNEHTHSWTFNSNLVERGTELTIKFCKFKNIPSENIFCGGNSIISNNYADDLNGSFVHQSASASSVQGNLIIEGNVLNNTNIYADEGFHNEACVTFSNASRKIVISNNRLSTCGGSFLGDIGGDTESTLDIDILVSNNFAEDIDGVSLTRVTTANTPKNYTYTDNQFINFQWFSFVTTNFGLTTGYGIDGVTITGNRFVNGWVYFDNCSNLIFANNDLKQTAGNVFSSSRETLLPANLTLNKCANYLIKGNVIEDLSEEYSIGIDYFGGGSEGTALKSDAVTDTNYNYHNRNSSIEGNSVLNYLSGIRHAWTSTGGWATSMMSLAIKNNIVQVRSAVGADVGIKIIAGIICSDNYVYGDSNVATAGIHVTGVNDAQKLLINGAICLNNTVMGITRPIRLGGNSTNSFNIVCKGNIVDRAIYNNTGGVIVEVDTTILPVTETLSIQTIRENPSFY